MGPFHSVYCLVRNSNPQVHEGSEKVCHKASERGLGTDGITRAVWELILVRGRRSASIKRPSLLPLDRKRVRRTTRGNTKHTVRSSTEHKGQRVNYFIQYMTEDTLSDNINRLLKRHSTCLRSTATYLACRIPFTESFDLRLLLVIIYL